MTKRGDTVLHDKESKEGSTWRRGKEGATWQTPLTDIYIIGYAYSQHRW